MASGYTIFNSFNQKSTQNMDKTSRARFRTEDILIDDIYSNDRNFYDQKGIEEKANEILAVGLLSNLVVANTPSEDGVPYRLISGERRWRALQLLVQWGFDEFQTVTCQVRTPSNEHEELIELILANSFREKDVVTLIKEEQTLKQELQYMRDNGMRLNGYDLQSGKLRDIVASMLNVSKTKIAEIDAISNRLLPEFKKALEEEKITFSAAYQLSKLGEDEQIALYEKYERAGGLAYADVVAYADALKRMHESALRKKQLPGQLSMEEMEEVFENAGATEPLKAVQLEKSDESEAAETEEAVQGNTEAVEQKRAAKGNTEAVELKEAVQDNTEAVELKEAVQGNTEAVEQEEPERDNGKHSDIDDIDILELLIVRERQRYELCAEDKSAPSSMTQRTRVLLDALLFYEKYLRCKKEVKRRNEQDRRNGDYKNVSGGEVPADAGADFGGYVLM